MAHVVWFALYLYIGFWMILGAGANSNNALTAALGALVFAIIAVAWPLGVAGFACLLAIQCIVVWGANTDCTGPKATLVSILFSIGSRIIFVS